MPLAIFIPFAVKGAVVAAKWIASKHAAANVARTVIAANHTFGAAATVNAALAGATVVGIGVWTVERLAMAKRAIRFFDEGDLLGAANEITRIARSCFQVEGHDFVENARHWVSAGADIHSHEFSRLISDIRQIVDETALTARPAR